MGSRILRPTRTLALCGPTSTCLSTSLILRNTSQGQMVFAGLKKEKERADIIAYISQNM